MIESIVLLIYHHQNFSELTYNFFTSGCLWRKEGKEEVLFCILITLSFFSSLCCFSELNLLIWQWYKLAKELDSLETTMSQACWVFLGLWGPHMKFIISTCNFLCCLKFLSFNICPKHTFCLNFLCECTRLWEIQFIPFNVKNT